MKIIYKIIFVTLFTLIFIIMLSINYNVKADRGAKPSITIKLKNMKTTNYIIDLLVYDKDGTNYNDKMDYNGNGLTDDEIKKLYDINLDGWISESTRWNSYLLFSDCVGNKNYTHTFSYFGTPERYKVLIINNDTGEMLVSNEIVREGFTSIIEIDINTMGVKNKVKSQSYINIVLLPLIITLLIELVVAILMKIGHLKLITLVNILTNTSLNILLSNFISFNIINFIILEIIVFVIEYLVYKISIKNIKNNKILKYTLISNFASMVITFIPRMF